MRAVRTSVGGPIVDLRIEELPIPEPAEDEVVIRVANAGVNPVDWKTVEGGGIANRVTSPYTPGWDVAGVVTVTGRSVNTFREGDRVFGLVGFPERPGTFATHCVAAADELALIPSGLTTEQAAAVPMVALTAWQAVFGEPGIMDGQRVLIHGASGGVGNFAVQYAHIVGAEVYGTSSPENFETNRGLGVDVPIDRTIPGFETSMPGGSFDFILDSQRDMVRDRAHILLKERGVFVSIRSGSPPESLQETRIQYRSMLVHPDGSVLVQISRMFDNSSLSVRVARTFPLARVNEALALLKKGAVNGKIVINCS
jgi:NADPH:quinone reductase-like Zn-dependent oxidoreductase